MEPQSPYAGDALYARAIVVLRRQQKTVQDYREVERVLDEFLLRFPNTTRRMETLYWSGVAAHGADDAPKAEERLRAALNEKPSAEYEREIKLELAAVLKKRGAEREAAELFTSLLDTKAVDRLTPELLEWTARTMINAQKWDAAIAAASTLERRQIEPAWKQVAATLVGQAREGMGEKDAAMEAYARALATGSNTESGAQAALALGRLESANGLFNEARKHLNDAISRAQSPEMSPLRDQAQSALAEIDERLMNEKREEKFAQIQKILRAGSSFDNHFVVLFLPTDPKFIRKWQAFNDEVKNWGQNHRLDDAFALIDTTAFGSGDEGVLIDKLGITVRTMFRNKNGNGFISWEDFSRNGVAVETGNWTGELKLYDSPRIQLGGLGSSSEKMVKLFEQILEVLRETTLDTKNQ